MGWYKEHKVREHRKALRTLFKGRMYVTEHFTFRLVNRYTVEERRTIIAEIYRATKLGILQSQLVSTPGGTPFLPIGRAKIFIGTHKSEPKTSLVTVYNDRNSY